MREEGRKISIVLADDHTIVREGVASILGSESDFSIVGQASDGNEAVEMIRALVPDVAIVDLNMPKLHGIEVIRRTRKWNMQIHMGVLSISRDQKIVTEVLKIGANAYLLKDGPARHLVEAIRIIMDGGIYISPLLHPQTLLSAASRPAAADPLDSLSSREYQVFGFLVEGVRAKEIAARLDISPKTVDTYRSNVMRKLHIYDVPGLVKYALQRNLTSLD
jgi:DNA-binding NarL/FixJ family response regulator